MSFPIPLTSRRLLLPLLVLLLTLSQGSLAGRQFTVALHGYDPVAYFSDGEPRLGDLRFTHDWNGTNWVFASEANRQKFMADPLAYAPQYDGYCAYAASQGYVAPGDPRVWTIVEDRLYLNFSHQAKVLWEKDISGNIGKGNQNWMKLNSP